MPSQNPGDVGDEAESDGALLLLRRVGICSNEARAVGDGDADSD
eukprot:CAMPEP_0197033582 /NCGR_PEP_ID=MMETSP1384-20130603/11958_1 /TAXON_ID=29189 /ORGANISM="Ammonia sp." /LENGTH=43 /DNA_ID= /DNA_START= /DNA_END= /DNA_ORIENTATION=